MATAKISTFTSKNYEYDCTRKCRYVEHGNRITAALTKRSIGDDYLGAYIAKTCANYIDIVDDLVISKNKLWAFDFTEANLIF